MGDTTELKPGDIIKCHDKEDLLQLDDELNRGGYCTDFVYEVDGEKGYWIKILEDRKVNMKLKELFETTLVKDTDTIAVHVHVIGGIDYFRRGNWYQDQILDLMDRDIDTIMYCLGDWDINLVAKEEGE